MYPPHTVFVRSYQRLSCLYCLCVFQRHKAIKTAMNKHHGSLVETMVLESCPQVMEWVIRFPTEHDKANFTYEIEARGYQCDYLVQFGLDNGHDIVAQF